MIASSDILRHDTADGVTTLTMDDGKANVMGLPMLEMLDAALDHAEAQQTAVLLTARGRSFSGGFDLASFTRDPAELARMLEAGARLAARLLAHPRPVVAACNGHAIAMGAFLLLCADHRLCADDDLRIQLNEVQVGLTMPRFAIALCRQRLTAPWLHGAVTTARPLTPAQALAAGFVDELAAPADLPDAAHSRARALADLPRTAFAATKKRLLEPALEELLSAVGTDVAEWQALAARPSRLQGL